MLKHYGGVLILYHFRVLDWRKDMRSTFTFFMVENWGLFQAPILYVYKVLSRERLYKLCLHKCLVLNCKWFTREILKKHHHNYSVGTIN